MVVRGGAWCVNTHLQLLLRQRLTKLLPHSLESHGSGGCLLREERHFLALQGLHFGLLVLDKLLVAQPRKPPGLTPRGRALASEARRRHDLVIDFLRALGVDARTAALDAEGIEHHVSPATLRAMARYLERP